MSKAKDISGHAPGGKRVRLAEKLPLNTPYLFQVFPIYACNFKCDYCIFSVEKRKRGFISDQGLMPLDLFKKCVDDFAFFPDKAKVLRFVGMGEPLMHRDIAAMVHYAKDKNIAERIEILTNASLLTPAMSDALISAGLSRLIVSLQGTTAEKYREVCGAEIDFHAFVENLRYFFLHKGQGQVYIKIIDYALAGKEDEQRFRDIFGELCDTMAVEHVGPIYPGVDYGDVLKGREGSRTQFGLPVSDVKICPQPFFTMQVNPDGKVVPCYSIVYPEIMGDCRKQSVYEIWNGRKFLEFRRKMLDGIKAAGKVCEDCPIIKHRLFPEDSLNDDAGRLRRYYERS